MNSLIAPSILLFLTVASCFENDINRKLPNTVEICQQYQDQFIIEENAVLLNLTATLEIMAVTVKNYKLSTSEAKSLFASCFEASLKLQTHLQDLRNPLSTSH